MRKKNWEAELAEVIIKHQSLPSQYGLSDCFIITDDAVHAVTGSYMFGKASRTYKTPKAALKKLKTKGFNTVEDAFASKFKRIPATLAQRGDIGVIVTDVGVSGGVFTGVGFFTRFQDETAFFPVSMVGAAFKVD